MFDTPVELIWRRPQTVRGGAGENRSLAHESGVEKKKAPLARGPRFRAAGRSLTGIAVMQIKAGALRVATPSCQVGFNKAFMRVLVERLAQANRQLAQR